MRLLFLILLAPFMVFAQTARDTSVSADDTLNTLLVTATRTPKARLNTPQAIGAVYENDWSVKHARTSPEALQYAPGVFVQKTNHGGGSPFVRGLTGNQTLQLLDGVRLNNATFRFGPNQYFNTIDAFGLHRIEVLRGGGSVQYGTDALGGTLQAFTPVLLFSDDPSWHGQAIGRFATQGMEKTGRGEIGFSSTKLALRAGLTLRDFGDLVGDDTTGTQSPTGYTENDYDLKAAWQITPALRLTALTQRVQQLDVPVYHKVQLENFAFNEMALQERALHYLRLEGESKRAYASHWLLQGSLQNTIEERRAAKNNSAKQTDETDKVRSIGAVAQAESRWTSRWTSVTGVEYYHDKVNSSRTSIDLNTNTATGQRGLYPDGATMGSIGVFTLHEYQWTKWQLAAGLRYNHFSINVSDENAGDVELNPQALVWNASALWRFHEEHALFVGAQTGFRAPNIDDLGTLGIVDFRYEQPNYELEPEQSLQTQIGYKHHSTNLHWEAYWYQNNLEQLISRVLSPGDSISGYPVYQKENVEKALIQGFETDWNWRFHPLWTVDGALTYTYGQNRTRQEPLRRIPPLFGRVGVGFQPKQWITSAELCWAGEQDRLAAGDRSDNRIPKGGTPGWWVVNVHAAYTWKMISLRLSGLNLFNEDYRTHGSGVNGVGRSVWVTVGVGW
ncbi:MAG: TonB-dependent receptor plug domain-containing protein [Saprospiraceae bacterium]